MKKIILIFIFIVPAALYSQAPVFQQEQYPFSLTFYGLEPQLGFMNASEYYHQDFCDLDNDGDFDIIIAADFNREYYFKNIGSSSVPFFQFITYSIIEPISINAIYQAPCFCDIDNDDDLDIFLGDKYGPIMFYKNIGTPDSFAFFLYDSSFIDLSSAAPTMDFIDIDADGDYDLFLGIGWTPVTGRIYFYRNNGTPEVPIMNLESEYFEQIDVGDNAAPEFCDIDNDGDYDLFIGCDDGNVWYYENIGTPDSCDFEYVTNNYFNIDVGNMSVPRFCDIDADEDYDLFVGNESAAYTYLPEGDLVFYENIGTASVPNFQFRTRQYLFMDLGATASPNAVDIDNDGLSELLVATCSGRVVYFENTGSQTSPTYVYMDSAYLNLMISYQPVMSFGDLDGDGDLDFATTHGSFSGYVQIFQNIGSAVQPQFIFWQTITTSPIGSGFSGVDLCDIDADGDLDLFFGDEGNHLHYWENVGDANRPRFQEVSTNYLNQPIINPGVWLYPRFADMDHDGDYDIVMGNGFFSDFNNLINYWQNGGTPTNADFTLIDTIALYPPNTLGSPRPCLSDIDADGDLDMFVGESGGALLFYRNLENPYQAELTVAISNNDVILTWQTILGAEQYRIFYADSCYFTPSGTPQAVVLPPDTSWIDAGAAGMWGERFYRMVVGY